ncbi:glycosyltransferase family 2 protein [Parasporobacterium paucivorans]|uniref:Glycosyltransferase involved in cell wall bisynthesis n=1 Tax=Parasporobacterium paucivorans DSM 15970 TaxID=1122934 RepID=A0A1M6FPG8_9FIRM|nr:glycosyltransferase family 2 protein [Parasporobacterium paucivorans]SHI99621.1 Glycosyltransferase involved in cell wall bisynthesis [Parasporobacterium paucivorans DSM 15970]
MKLLTITVPCYNSQEYMRKCIDSLLPGGEDVEIIIVDDGSTDATAQIADEYAQKYPDMIRVIHQKNGGHGAGLNTGIRNATGLYFKVVDSDDWLESSAYEKLLKLIRKMNNKEQTADLIVCNYVYENQNSIHKKVMNCRRAMPRNRMITWENKMHFRYTQYILMHSAIFKTQVLRDSGVVMPEHQFYVDNVFVYAPLPYVKTLYYLDVDLYRYYIGRSDQSVNEQTMIRRIDQQINVNKIIIDTYNKTQMTSVGLEKYMRHYLTILMGITSLFLVLSENEADAIKKRELWGYLKKENPVLFNKTRWTFIGLGVNLPGRAGRRITIFGYRILQKLIGFN